MKKIWLAWVTIVSFVIIGAGHALAASMTKITASDPEAGDYFGESVAISGDDVIVGADYEDTGAADAGAAYLFHRTDTNTWSAAVKIQAADPNAADYFGRAVSLEGDYAIIGAPWDDAGASNGGAAYIFHRTAVDTWGTGIKIMAADPEGGDNFGQSVSIDGDYAIVGAPYEDSGASNGGAAYIFHRTDTNTWEQDDKILASDPQNEDHFGQYVAISGNYVIVGAPDEDTIASGAGAVYFFYRVGAGDWGTGTKIQASDPETDAHLGRAVGISGDYAIAGAYGVDIGVNTNAGAAYVFHRTGINTWDGGTKLIASDNDYYDAFGWSVSISGPYAIVGAYQEDSIASGAGAAYLFNRTTETTWSAPTKITAFDAEGSDYFGGAVSISGSYALIASQYENPESVADAGSAYIYNHDLPAAIDLLSFGATWADAGAALNWITGTETECGAFTILRCELAELLDGAESYCPLDEYQELDLTIPCTDSLYGAEYEAFDPTADSTVNYSYILREYETTGSVKEYGPALLYSLKHGAEVPDAGEEIPDDPSTGAGQASDDDANGSAGGDGSDDDASSDAEQDEDTAENTEAGCGM